MALVFTLGSNYAAVSHYTGEILFPSPQPISIVLPPATGFEGAEEKQLLDWIRERMFVSNYKAEIYVSRFSRTIEPGDSFVFHFYVSDLGINRLSQGKYFYILGFDPEGRLTTFFPRTTEYLGHLPATYSKYATWYIGDLPYDSSQLFNGTAGDREIWYRLNVPDDPSSIGRWRIYVLVFDNTYLDRWGRPMGDQSPGGYSNPEINNAVAYTTESFDVTAKSAPQPVSMAAYVPLAIQFLVPFALTYSGYYLRAAEFEAFLLKVTKQLRKHWLFLLMVTALLLFFLFGR